MRIPSALLFVFAFCVFAPASRAELSEKEIIAIMNSVSSRVARGDATALDDLKKLSTQDMLNTLFIHILQNKDVDRPANQAIAKRGAKIITETEGYEEFFVTFLQSLPNEPRWADGSREKGIDTLEYINNKASVRVLCGALSDPKVSARTAAKCAHRLALMNVPGGAYTKAEWREAYGPAGVVKWKAWWERNSNRFAK